MRLNEAVQQFINDQDWLGLANYYWTLLPDQAHLGILALGALLVVVLIVAVRSGHGPTISLPDDLAQVDRRGHKPKGALYIPLELGDVTVDLQPKMNETIHTAIGGTSRLGKSTTVLPLLDLPCGVLIIALDNTRPIMDRVREIPDGIEWTNEPDWPIGLDLLRGSSRIVSEVLVEGWSAKTGQDTGKWRRISRQRLWDALDAMDSEGIERSIPDLARALWVKSGDAEIDRACRDWAGRLLLLARTLGSSLGTDLDITQAMREGKKVLLRVNPYLNPLDAPMLSGMMLVHARRAAQEAGVPFVIIVEEAGQMDEYQEEMTPLAQAAADRGTPLVILTQNLSKLPLSVANNISVWVSFAQEAKSEMAWVAHKLRLEPEHMWREAFPGKGEAQGRGWCYVRAPGVSTRLVNIRLPKKVAYPAALPAPAEPVKKVRRAQPWEIVEQPLRVDGWRPWTPELPAPDADEPHQEDVPAWIGIDRDFLRLWEKCVRTGREAILWSPSRGVFYDRRGCLEWTGGMFKSKRSGAPRPRSTIGDRDITVYIEFYRRARGNPDPTLDHLCQNSRCCDPDHLEPCQVGENTARNTPRKLAFELAGWTSFEGRWVRSVLAAG